MSSNLKSGNAVVRLLLTHGEKLGILAILVCTGLIIWSALGRERLQLKPDQMSTLARQADQHMANITWNDLKQQDDEFSSRDPEAEGSVVIAQPLPPSVMVKIPADAFPTYDNVFNEPVSAPVTLRQDPVLLALSELEVDADSGLWASADPEKIKQRMLDMKKDMEEKRREQEAMREKMQRDGGRGGRGGPGGMMGEGGYGGMMGEGGYGGGRGGLAGSNTKRPKDAPIVQIARQGARVQGFEQIQAKSWVTVLAKVPIKAQNEMYTDALGTSRGYNPSVDKPKYLGYQVERAEITSAGQSEWKMIKFVKKSSLEAEISKYPVSVPDVIDPAVKHPLLTHPLPPLILQEWGERVSHSSMPLAAEVQRLKMEEMKNPKEEEEEKPAEGEPGEEGLFDDVVTARERAAAAGARGRGGMMGEGGYGMMGEGGYGGMMGRGGMMGEGGYGGMMGEGGYGGMMGEGGYGGMMGEGGYGGMMGEGGYGGMMGRGGMMGGMPGMGSDTVLPPYVWDGETEYALFRYFDNTAKPGHSYRYRIRLAMTDVNHKVPEQHLDPMVTQRREPLSSGEKKYRWTDWSEVSPVASVPLPARIYLVNTKPVKEGAFTGEPEAEILVKALNSEFAAEIARSEELGRGYVINLFDKAKVIWASKMNQAEFPEFKFLTGITLLDFDGGEKLGRSKMVSTSRALMMDAAGHLFVQKEMEDLETNEEYAAIIEADKNNRNRGGVGRGGYGGMMGEGGYGGGGEF